MFNKKQRYLISYLLLIVLFLLQPLSLLSVSANENADEIHISSAKELLELSEQCVTDTWSQDKVIVLDRDIDLSSTDFQPIPTFGGIFLGQDHTISGLSITGGSDNTGFFRYIQESGEIYNLILSGTASAESTHTDLALLAGCNQGLISGCSVNGNVTGGDCVGGIAGLNDITGIITDCSAEGMIYGNHMAGGFSGTNKGSITNGRNYCAVNIFASENDINLSTLTVSDLFTTENAASVTDIGGIAGSNKGLIRACVNEGAVGYQHVGYNIGGIAGSQTGYIEGCVNYGTLNGRKDIGGIAGQMEPSSELIFSEDTLKKLNKEFNTLHRLVTQLLNDAGDTSTELTGQITRLLASVEDAQRTIDEISAQLSSDMDELSQSTDLSSLPSPKPISLDFLDKIPTPSVSPSVSPSPGQSPTPEQTPSPAQTPTPEQTPSPAQTPTPEQAPSPAQTSTPEQTPTPEQTTSDANGQTKTDLKKETESVTPKKLLAEPSTVTPEILQDPNASLAPPAATQTPTSTAAPTESPDKLPHLSPFPSFSPGLDVLPTDFSFDKKAAEKEINKAQDNLYDGAVEVLEGMEDSLKRQASLISSRITSSHSMLSSSFSGIISEFKLLNTMLDEENQTLLNDFQAIADEINVIGNLITDPQTTDPEDIISDVSAEDTLSDTTGKVMNCANRGKINGDLNVGGIAGSLSRENNLDPEDDLNLDRDNATLNFRYKERIVIRECENTGTVTGKKDCIGGIAGNMVLGSVISCIGNGAVSGDGDMIGGIAGLSEATIRDSYAKCALSGQNRIGGIAGFGKTIQDCCSMVEIKEGQNYLGSIVGKTESLENISNNYFVEGCPAGIDGINYTGAAQALPYASFMTLEHLPDIFQNIYLTFTADERIVSVVTLKYGESFERSRLPAVPPKEGCSGIWEEFDTDSVTFDRTVNAVYSEYITTLESIQTLNGKPIALVEGTFDTADRFILSEINAYPDDAKTAAECYKISINSDDTGPYTVRYLIPSDMQSPVLELFQNNAWIPLEGTIDGSYYVFSSSMPEFVFCCVDRPSLHTGIIRSAAFIAAAFLLFIAGIVIRQRMKKKHNAEKE